MMTAFNFGAQSADVYCCLSRCYSSVAYGLVFQEEEQGERSNVRLDGTTFERTCTAAASDNARYDVGSSVWIMACRKADIEMEVVEKE